MAYTEKLADRVRDLIFLTHTNVVEKKIFGGLCFMVNGKMCISVKTEQCMFRIDPAVFDEVIKKDGCRQVVMKGNVMKGFVYVATEALTTKKKLQYWVGLALAYNQIAGAPRKKKY